MIAAVGFWGTSLVGQLIVAQPFLWVSRGEPWAFVAVGVVAACIAVIASYWIGRRLVTPRRAVLAPVTLIVFPRLDRQPEHASDPAGDLRGTPVHRSVECVVEASS